MLLEFNQIEIPPGHKVCLTEVSWLEFEKMLFENKLSAFRRIL